MVDDFRHVYLRLCKDHHVEPEDTILTQIKSAKTSTVKGGALLNMSTQSLGAKMCGVLGKALTTDRAFTEIRFNDCMLPEDGVRALAQGLAINQACKKLSMKGNNIRGSAVESLGRMMRENKRLLSICFEWNCVGMLETPFSVFCEGLGSNMHIQVLDLRNNQITHNGAQELCSALKRNTTLRMLDLRWNNLGLIGGRAMLNALTQNKTIVKLEVAGNNIPNDVICAIEKSIDHNAEKDTLVNNSDLRQRMLSNEIQQLKRQKAEEISGLFDKMDRQEAALRNSTKSQQSRIQQLHEALEDRKVDFNNMAAKLSLTESEFAMSETKINELGSLLSQARDDQTELASFHKGEMKREREDRAVSEGRLNKEILGLNAQNIALQDTNAHVEAKVRTQQEQIYQLKEELTHNSADSVLKTAQFEERVQAEKQRTKEVCRDADEMKQKEITRVRHEAEETERALKERVSRLEHHRIEQEEEASRLRNQITAEKLAAEEHLLMAKQRIKSEEEQRCQQLKEKIRLLQTGKDDLQLHATHLSGSITELQTKNSNLVLELEGLKHKVEDQQLELAGKNNEMLTETGKVRIEMNARITKMEGERQTQAELYNKIAKLEREFAELTEEHRKVTTKNSAEISQLTEQLRQRDATLKQLREEDANRAFILTNAIQTYVTKSPFPH